METNRRFTGRFRPVNLGDAPARDTAGPERQIALKLDSGDAVILGPGHPLTLTPGAQGPSPRVLVRHGLEAELARPVYYELAEIALAEGASPPGVWSGGCFFALDSAP